MSRLDQYNNFRFIDLSPTEYVLDHYANNGSSLISTLKLRNDSYGGLNLFLNVWCILSFSGGWLTYSRYQRVSWGRISLNDPSSSRTNNLWRFTDLKRVFCLFCLRIELGSTTYFPFFYSYDLSREIYFVDHGAVYKYNTDPNECFR